MAVCGYRCCICCCVGVEDEPGGRPGPRRGACCCSGTTGGALRLGMPSSSSSSSPPVSRASAKKPGPLIPRKKGDLIICGSIWRSNGITSMKPVWRSSWLRISFVKHASINDRNSLTSGMQLAQFLILTVNQPRSLKREWQISIRVSLSRSLSVGGWTYRWATRESILDFVVARECT